MLPEKSLKPENLLKDVLWSGGQAFVCDGVWAGATCGAGVFIGVGAALDVSCACFSCAGATTAGFGPVCVDSGFAWGILVMEGIAFRGKGKNLPLKTI